MKCILILVLFFFTTISCSTRSEKKVDNSFALVLEEEVVRISYDELKAETLRQRDGFRKVYNTSTITSAKKDSILTEAGEYLLSVSGDFFKSWYRTPWTFDGHTEIPGEGSIACGYFITTTLRDMGFNSPRIKWAQQTSEYLIKRVTNDIKYFYNSLMTDIVGYITERGEGLYIVGLDSHVGYIYYYRGEMNFVHSNYYRRHIGVMSEPLIGRNPLNDSKIRVIGKIFDKAMIRNWILGTKYEA